MIIKPIIKSFTKITILTLVFFVILYLGSSIAQAWWWSSDKSSENIDNFVSIENYGLSEVGVALNINVGIKFYEQKAKENSSFYNDIVPIYTMKSDRNITNDILITKNVDSLRDYLNVTKINIKGYLDSGGERKDNYDSLMNQLKIRYKTGYANSKNLNTQIESIISHLEELDASITNIKESMSLNLKNYNAPGLNKNLNDYITIKNEITLMKVYVIFCNRFLSYYNLLNNYTKNTITTLRLNEDAIVKNSFIVVPNQGSELITKLNLVYNENDLTTTQNVNTTSTLDENIADISNQESSSFSYSSLNFDTDYSIDNSNNNGIFGDPFNLNGSVETIKQTGKIDFGAPNYINNN